MADVEKLQEIIDQSNNIVFFGGAGVSTESGIPDFRSKDGLYSEQYDNYEPETILSISFFKKHPSIFYKFYRDKILMQGQNLDIKPNAAHLKLAELEKAGKLKAIVTQNIDTLHQEAGSEKVYQIHGTIATNHCCLCNKEYSLEEVKNQKTNDMICECGGLIKPDIVFYEEELPMTTWNTALEAVSKADCLIIAGTSLRVYPAANIVQYFHGKYLVIINLDSTQADSMADLVIHDSIGKVFSEIKV